MRYGLMKYFMKAFPPMALSSPKINLVNVLSLPTTGPTGHITGYPAIDNLSDKASFEFIVTAPSHYRVVSNGILTEETNLADNKKLTHWKEEIPLPTKVMVIGVADFAVKQVPIVLIVSRFSAWVFPAG